MASTVEKLAHAEAELAHAEAKYALVLDLKSAALSTWDQWERAVDDKRFWEGTVSRLQHQLAEERQAEEARKQTVAATSSQPSGQGSAYYLSEQRPADDQFSGVWGNTSGLTAPVIYARY